jgi:hypothetical protein
MEAAQRQQNDGPIRWDDSELRALQRKVAEREAEARVEKERLARVAIIKNALPYSEAIAQEICERISVGQFLINICLDEHMPTQRRCDQWLAQNEDFAQLYSVAINKRLNVFEDEVVTIADDSRNDYKLVTKGKTERRVFDAENVSRAKLRIEVRFRHLKAGRPQKWGDSQTIISKTSEDDIVSNMSDAELEKKLADIDAKDRGGYGQVARSMPTVVANATPTHKVGLF